MSTKTGFRRLFVDGCPPTPSTRVSGDPVTIGNVQLAASCWMDGSVWSWRTVSIAGKSWIGVSVVASGNVPTPSTAHVRADAMTGGKFSSPSGTTAAQLQSAGALGGRVLSSATAAPAPSAAGTIMVSGTTSTDANVSAQAASGGQPVITGTTSLDGQFIGGKIATASTVTAANRPVETPGVRVG